MSDDRTHSVVVYTFHKTKRFSLTSTDAGGERIRWKNESMRSEGWDVLVSAAGLPSAVAVAMKNSIREAYERAGYRYQAAGEEYVGSLVDGKYQG